jgi:hypothetical protein
MKWRRAGTWLIAGALSIPSQVAGSEPAAAVPGADIVATDTEALRFRQAFGLRAESGLRPRRTN